VTLLLLLRDDLSLFLSILSSVVAVGTILVDDDVGDATEERDDVPLRGTTTIRPQPRRRRQSPAGVVANKCVLEQQPAAIKSPAATATTRQAMATSSSSTLPRNNKAEVASSTSSVHLRPTSSSRLPNTTSCLRRLVDLSVEALSLFLYPVRSSISLVRTVVVVYCSLSYLQYRREYKTSEIEYCRRSKYNNE